jgi:hypothetical protein
MDEWRTVTIPEETYVRLKAAAVSLAEAVSRAERAEQKAAPAPAATAEKDEPITDRVGQILRLRDHEDKPIFAMIVGATREQAESAAAKLADYDRINGELKMIYKFCDGQLAEAQRNALSPYHRGCEVTALAVLAAKHDPAAALQKPEGEPTNKKGA